jgi:hypothetical protein
MVLHYLVHIYSSMEWENNLQMTVEEGKVAIVSGYLVKGRPVGCRLRVHICRYLYMIS